MTAILDKKRMGASEVAAEIRAMIVAGSLNSHDRLPSERALCARYGVSRGTIRDALLRLKNEGLIEIRLGSGSYVLENLARQHYEAIIRNTRPLELVDVRFALEPHICRLAVLHGQVADFDRLESHINEMEENADDAQIFAHVDARFHLDLVKSTNNSLLIWIIGEVNEVRKQEQWAQVRSITLKGAIIRTYNAQHRAILTALRARDSEGAANQMKEHLDTARKSLTQAIGS